MMHDIQKVETFRKKIVCVCLWQLSLAYTWPSQFYAQLPTTEQLRNLSHSACITYHDVNKRGQQMSTLAQKQTEMPRYADNQDDH